MEKANKSRTFLVLDDEAHLLAYFTLALKTLQIPAEAGLSRSAVKRMDGVNKKAASVSGYLVGQLGKNSSIENSPVDLKYLLDAVTDQVAKAYEAVGGNTIFIECERGRLVQLYEDHGFTPIPITDTDGGLVTLFKIIDLQ